MWTGAQQSLIKDDGVEAARVQMHRALEETFGEAPAFMEEPARFEQSRQGVRGRKGVSQFMEFSGIAQSRVLTSSWRMPCRWRWLSRLSTASAVVTPDPSFDITHSQGLTTDACLTLPAAPSIHWQATNRRSGGGHLTSEAQQEKSADARGNPSARSGRRRHFV